MRFSLRLEKERGGKGWKGTCCAQADNPPALEHFMISWIEHKEPGQVEIGLEGHVHKVRHQCKECRTGGGGERKEG